MSEFIFTGTKFLHGGRVYAAGDTVSLSRVPPAFAGMFEEARHGPIRAAAAEIPLARPRRGRPPKKVAEPEETPAPESTEIT